MRGAATADGRDAAAAREPGGRAPEIDAIRGWAALSVVCFHVLWETFGVVVPEFRSPWAAPFLAGRFDVAVFFVLSGDALSHPFLHGGGLRYVQRAALKRYLRLTVPIAVVTAATALLMTAGLAPTEAAGAVVGRSDWLGGFARFPASASTAFRFATLHVYEGGFKANYLPFLWTMPIEMLGSAALFLALAVHDRVRHAGWVVAVVALALIQSGVHEGCFLVGLLIGRLRAAGAFARVPPSVGLVLAPLGAVAALAIAGRLQSAGEQGLPSTAAAATLLLASVNACGPAVRWLARSRTSQFLGRVSFLLYLWHFPVLIAVTSGLIVAAADADGSIGTPAALAIAGVTVAGSLALARATLFVEGWARRANDLALRALWVDDARAPRPEEAIGPVRRVPTLSLVRRDDAGAEARAG